MAELKQIVEKYLQAAGEFGKPVPLSAFGLSREETERTFSAFEEDYHIGRFLSFMDQPAVAASHQSFQINGFPQTHVAIGAAVREIL